MSSNRPRPKLNLSKVGVHRSYAKAVNYNDPKPNHNWKRRQSFNPNKTWINQTNEEKEDNKKFRGTRNKIEYNKINKIISKWQNKPTWDELQMMKFDLRTETLQVQYRWWTDTALGNWHNKADDIWEVLIKYNPLMERLKYYVTGQEPYGKG
eukprot:3258_1